MARREPDRLVYDDRMIHCCLYFIAPHRLKHIDIAFMRALHRKVNIVPIIAKSDTMTTKEKEEFKLQAREALVSNPHPHPHPHPNLSCRRASRSSLTLTLTLALTLTLT